MIPLFIPYHISNLLIILWVLGFCDCFLGVCGVCVLSGSVLSKSLWPNLLYERESESRSVVSYSLPPHGLYRPWNSPDQNTGVGNLSLLQGIFPTQGSNPGLLHYRQILYQLSHKGSPRIQEWVAYPFSSGSSQSRNWTGVSCTAGRFFTSWATGEAAQH